MNLLFQVYISSATYAHVEQYVKATKGKGKTNYSLDGLQMVLATPEPILVAIPPANAAPLRAFLAPAVAQRVGDESTGAATTLLAELRTVTVVFCSLQIALSGSDGVPTASDEDVGRVQKAVVACQQVI